MKRSTAVSLMLLGAAGIGVYTMSGNTETTGETTEANVFKGVDECMTSRDLDPAACRAAHENATKTHAQSAPRFESQADCEKQFGAAKCTGTVQPGNSSSIASYFIPAMLGYAVARSFGGGASRQPSAAAATAQPVYGCPAGQQIRRDGTCYSTRTGSAFFMAAGRALPGRATGTPNANSTRTQLPALAFAGAAVASPLVSRGSSLSQTQTVSRGGFGRTGSTFSSSST